jgi:phosphatidylethanolamine-binding protein (PEBP) family uncharacterized protein
MTLALAGLPAMQTAAYAAENDRQGGISMHWKKTAYGGPCPPIGRHRYIHKLYALDIVLPDLGEPDKADLEKAMAGHVLAYRELIGTYRR